MVMRCDSSVRLLPCARGTYIVCKQLSIAVLLIRNVLFFFLLLSYSLKDSGEQRLYYYIFNIELQYAMMSYIVYFAYCGIN